MISLDSLNLTDADFADLFAKTLTISTGATLSIRPIINTTETTSTNDTSATTDIKPVDIGQTAEIRVADEDIVWKTMGTIKQNPEGQYICQKCGQNCTVHPGYIKVGINPCLGPKCKNTVESIAKQMCTIREYTFISISAPKGKASGQRDLVVNFTCSNDHKSTLTIGMLRKGAGCKECQKLVRSRNNTNTKLADRPKCACTNINGKTPKFCPHYNHLTHGNGSADEWDFSLNGIVTPDKIAPTSNENRRFKCKNDMCKMSYVQSPSDRVLKGRRCPYCARQKACHWNCLLTRYPELCEELSEKNHVSPADVTPGSNADLIWECHKHEELPQPFTWRASPKHRITGNTKCPLCTSNGYLQRIGGHKHFITEAKLKHNNDYDYPEEYKGDKVKIAILCKRDLEHGIFMQTPHAHKAGGGCWKCVAKRKESRGMRRLKEILDKVLKPLGIDYTYEQKFDGLVYRGSLRCDIYIKGYNLVIEYDGKQHFGITSWGGQDVWAENKIRDQLKDAYFVLNKINFVRIAHITEPTEALILYILEQCKRCQLYASYPHYITETEKLLGTLLDKNVVQVACPKLG